MINKTTINRLTVIIVLLTVIFSCDGGRAVLRADLNLALRLSGENILENIRKESVTSTDGVLLIYKNKESGEIKKGKKCNRKEVN